MYEVSGSSIQKMPDRKAEAKVKGVAIVQKESKLRNEKLEASETAHLVVFSEVAGVRCV